MTEPFKSVFLLPETTGQIYSHKRNIRKCIVNIDPNWDDIRNRSEYF